MTVGTGSDGRPVRSRELQAQARSFHVPMAGAHRRRAAEYKIDPGDAGVANAPPEQRDVEPVPANAGAVAASAR
jgi:hypothetical protein